MARTKANTRKTSAAGKLRSGARTTKKSTITDKLPVATWATLAWKKFARNEQNASQTVLAIFLDQLVVINPSKPAQWKTITRNLADAIECETKESLTQQNRKLLGKWANDKIQAMTSESLFEPSQAPYFRPDQMSKFWDILWASDLLVHKEVAVASYIAYFSGARTIETCKLNIEDIQKRQDSTNIFIKMPLRTSKTNKYKERREAITLPITQNGLKPILEWIDFLVGNRTSGLLFNNLNTSKVVYHYIRTAKKLDWKIHPTGHSMRVSYVINAVIAGVPDEHIVACCRWATPAMLEVYKNSQLQDTIYGSAYQVIRLVEAHMYSQGLISPSKNLPALPNCKTLRELSAAKAPKTSDTTATSLALTSTGYLNRATSLTISQDPEPLIFLANNSKSSANEIWEISGNTCQKVTSTPRPDFIKNAEQAEENARFEEETVLNEIHAREIRWNMQDASTQTELECQKCREIKEENESFNKQVSS